MERNIKKSKAIAFSAILTAISVVIMLIGGFLEIFDMASAMLASFCIIFAVIEMGSGYAIGVYSSVSILSFLLLPAKTPALFFTSFFGLYPIVKSLSERTGKVASWIIKFLFFLASVSLTAFIYFKLFVSPDALNEFSKLIIPFILLLVCAFVFYDITLSYSITVYIRNLRKRLRIDKMFRL